MEKNIIYHGSNVVVPKPKILIKFKYPTHQIVFCTEEALNTLYFEGSVTL